MTVRALRRIAELVEAGATVVGRRPVGSPSLADDDAEHQRLCDLLWSPSGRGQVIDTADLAAALDELGVRPRSTVEGGDLLRIAPAHRGPRGRLPGESLAGADDGDRADELRPTSRRLGPGVAAADGRCASGALTLPPVGSVFLVEGGHGRRAVGRARPRGGARRPLAADPAGGGGVPAAGGPAALDRPGRRPRPASPGSGGTAPRSISTRRLGEAAAFLVAEVGDIARVRVNGVDCGVLWTAPFRVDVTQALRPGRNVVELDVANAWMNRLIAEAATPTGRALRAGQRASTPRTRRRARPASSVPRASRSSGRQCTRLPPGRSGASTALMRGISFRRRSTPLTSSGNRQKHVVAITLAVPRSTRTWRLRPPCSSRVRTSDTSRKAHR